MVFKYNKNHKEASLIPYNSVLNFRRINIYCNPGLIAMLKI